MSTPPFVMLTRFAHGRLFPEPRRLNAIQDVSPEAFEAHLNAHAPERVLPGYASFCQLWLYRNWTSTRCMAVRIASENRHLLRSAYVARTRDELPVLTRWFENVTPPVAEYLIVIVYDRAQMAREGDDIETDWGVVGCLPTMDPEEVPMAPITMMRNALGIAEGGSGAPLDHAAYARSVEFWQQHATWRDTDDARTA